MSYEIDKVKQLIQLKTEIEFYENKVKDLRNKFVSITTDKGILPNDEERVVALVEDNIKVTYVTGHTECHLKTSKLFE